MIPCQVSPKEIRVKPKSFSEPFMNPRQNRNTHRYREQADGGQMEGGLGEPSEKGESLQKYKLVVTKQSGDVKDSIGNTVNNIRITMYSVKWVPG